MRTLGLRALTANPSSLRLKSNPPARDSKVLRTLRSTSRRHFDWGGHLQAPRTRSRPRSQLRRKDPQIKD